MNLNKKNFNRFIMNRKIKFIYDSIKEIKNLNILEFGVREGVSTNMFLHLCNNNKGNLLSVDIVNCEKLFTNKNWTFLKAEMMILTMLKNILNKN